MFLFQNTIKIKSFGDDEEVNELWKAVNDLGAETSGALLEYVREEKDGLTKWYVFKPDKKLDDEQLGLIDAHNAQNYSRENQASVPTTSGPDVT